MASRPTPEQINALRAKYGDTINTSDLIRELGATLYQACADGALMKKSRGVYSLTGEILSPTPGTAIMPGPPPPQMSKEEKAQTIQERFDVMDELTTALISGTLRSLTISGAPGVGKSYNLEHALAEAESKLKLKSVLSIKGSISAIGLYMALYDNRTRGQVIVLDDCDSIFNDEEAMNILKSALDTSRERHISWMKESAALKEADIPQKFEYKGQMVFLTNVDMYKVIDKGGKMAPHMGALMSRSVFLDLGIHNLDEIMIRIEQVLATSKMAKDLDLSDDEVNQIQTWMNKHLTGQHRLRAVSLRTVIQIATFMKSTKDWQKVAAVTLLSSRF